MGSKTKLLGQIWDIASEFSFENVIDLFSGSGVVSYMFKTQGKSVLANDYMSMASTYARAMIANDKVQLSRDEAIALLARNSNSDGFVAKTFHGLYFSAADNRLIDSLRANIQELRSPAKRSIATSALIRACLKKRPRGIFTYVGQRYDDGRLDLRTTLRQHFLDAVDAVNNAVFDNGTTCRARHGDAMTVPVGTPGLVYIDPPYYSPFSDNGYVRRYHFVEGIARNWDGVEIQDKTLTKKFKSYPTPFSSRVGASAAFAQLFRKFRDHTIIVSYSSNSLPTLDEMVTLMKRHTSRVEVVPVEHRYSFGNQAKNVGANKNKVNEYLFVGF